MGFLAINIAFATMVGPLGLKGTSFDSASCPSRGDYKLVMTQEVRERVVTDWRAISCMVA